MSTSSSSTFPIAGVVCGILGPVIIVDVIWAFAWYKVKSRQPVTDEEETSHQNTVEIRSSKRESETPSANLGDIIEHLPSARLREDR